MSADLGALADRLIQTRDGLPDAIAKALREAVFTGIFAPNERLNQDVIAQQFGVSRVPVREALAKLVAEGLAVQRLNKGIRVAPLSKHDFQDIMELRALLEPQALRLSAPGLSASDYEEADAILDQVKAATMGPEAATLHWTFHNRLYVHANRPRLIAQIETLQLAISRYYLPIWRAVGLADEWDESHRDIVTALRDGEVEDAARLTRDQIQHATSRMMDQLPTEAAGPDGE